MTNQTSVPMTESFPLLSSLSALLHNVGATPIILGEVS